MPAPTGLAPSPLFLLLLATTAAGGALAALTGGTARTAGIVALVLGGWAVALCLHEFGHAVTAYRGGDRSVRAKGYLTLDIRRYTDPVMSLLLPLALLALGGVPLPGGAVWINRAALRSRAVASAVSLAGPLTNLVLGAAITAVVATSSLPDGLAAGLSYLALVQILAFVLNILPVPGLDGFGVLEPYLARAGPPVRRRPRLVCPLTPVRFDHRRTRGGKCSVRRRLRGLRRARWRSVDCGDRSPGVPLLALTSSPPTTQLDD